MPRKKADKRDVCQVSFDFFGGHYAGPAKLVERRGDNEFTIQFRWEGKLRLIDIYRDEITEWPENTP